MSLTAAAALQNRRHRDEREALVGLCGRLERLADEMMESGDEWYRKRFVGMPIEITPEADPGRSDPAARRPAPLRTRPDRMIPGATVTASVGGPASPELLG